MSHLRSYRRGPSRPLWAGVFLAVVVMAALGASIAYSAASSDGTPPPEVTANTATGWPLHNFDLLNSRANLTSNINSTNVATLKPKWTFKITSPGTFGAYSSTPIVLDGIVYLQDTNSNVYALNQDTGALLWEKKFNSPTPSGGPNGVTVGYGLIFGATSHTAFALDLKTGKQVWAHNVARNAKEGITLAPQVFGGKVLFSSIPGRALNFYKRDSYGIIWVFDAKSGNTLWKFTTVKSKRDQYAGGGGIWYPPAVDSQGRVFLGIANPAPFPLSPNDPNAKSRPGANLYTDSLVALDGDTGKLLWFNQVTKHDLRDYDFQISPVVATQPVNGVATEIVIGAGKSGKVVAFRADNGQRVWSINVGRHQNDIGPLPKKPVLVCPGPLGGVETPMAYAGNALFVPYVNMCAMTSSTSLGKLDFAHGTGGIVAVNPATGAKIWEVPFKSLDVGAATVSNDVVFTSTFAGTIYGLSVKDGSVLWSTQAPAGVNAFPAVTKNLLIVGAGSPQGAKSVPSIVAYSLNGQ
jgi:outer membrane protein assembly factor BamB